MAGAINSSYVGVREDLLGLIPEPPPIRVLDVGCANGATSAALKQRFPAASVTGIEYGAELARQASERLDRVLTADAIEGLEQLAAEGESFDLVLCGDVLEHLIDPWRALALIRRVSVGHVIVSLPNIAHVSTLWSLLVARRWPYRERGIHDRTHLRFFAANNLPELFGGAGFTELKRRQHHRLLERPHPINEKLSGVLRWLPGASRLTCYQFISLLRPEPAGLPAHQAE